MEQILLIAQILVFAGLAALCVALIVTLVQVRRSLREFVQSVHRIELTTRDVADRLLPILDHIEDTASRARSIVQEIGYQIATVRSAIRLLNSGVDSIARLRDRVEAWVMKPFENGAGMLAGLIRGAKTFASRMKTEEDEPGRRSGRGM